MIRPLPMVTELVVIWNFGTIGNAVVGSKIGA